MKIYTKTGDKGLTSLIGGRRVSKNDTRVEAYGTIDELISANAVLRDSINDNELVNIIISIQDKLMTCASILACGSDDQCHHLPEIDNEDITFLEKQIDKMDDEIPVLTSFILPGGNLSSSYSHISRSICRRAERRVLSINDVVNPMVIMYLNRLSDFYFTFARYLLFKSGGTETPWIGAKKQ